MPLVLEETREYLRGCFSLGLNFCFKFGRIIIIRSDVSNDVKFLESENMLPLVPFSTQALLVDAMPYDVFGVVISLD